MVQRKGVSCWKSKDCSLPHFGFEIISELEFSLRVGDYLWLLMLLVAFLFFFIFSFLIIENPQVPSLEHNGKVTGESMDLLTYLDEHFGGPKLAPTVSNYLVLLRLLSLLSWLYL